MNYREATLGYKKFWPENWVDNSRDISQARRHSGAVYKNRKNLVSFCRLEAGDEAFCLLGGQVQKTGVQSQTFLQLLLSRKWGNM